MEDDKKKPDREDAAGDSPADPEETDQPSQKKQEDQPSPEKAAGKQAGKPEKQAGPEPGKTAKSESKKPPATKPPAKKPVKRRAVRSRGPVYEDLEEDSLLEALQQRFGESAVSGQQFLEQPIYSVDFEALYEVMIFLCDDPECQFDYLVDLTALDYLGEEKRFCLVYHLYSHTHDEFIRVKSKVAEGVFAPSVTSIWTTADWLEREVFDMFGIEFSGHPDLKRILLPEDWHGHPLRKDYDIKLQDQSWIRKHLRIRKVPT